MSAHSDCEDLLILTSFEVGSLRMLEKQGCRSHFQLCPSFFRCAKSLFLLRPRNRREIANR